MLANLDKFINYQNLLAELDNPLHYIPYDIFDIADTYNMLLKVNEPTFYPFDDMNLTRIMENIYANYSELDYYLMKYYECRGPLNNLYPYRDRYHQMSDQDHENIQNITNQLRCSIYEWLEYRRNISS